MPTKSVISLEEEADVTDEIIDDDDDEKLASRPSFLKQTESRVRLKWDDRLAQLKIFRAKHGHVDVPRSYNKDPSLGTFVCNQRQTYKRMNEGKGPVMDRIRVQQLNELGFKWVLKHRDQPVLVDSDDDISKDGNNLAFAPLKGPKPPKPKPLTWEIGMQQLRTFQLANGHTDVPHIYVANQPLGNFVKSIRQSYKSTQKGQVNKLLNDQRIFELQQMGFKLQVRHREPWEQRFEELKRHFHKHGNCEIPKNTPLGVWILNQRSQFKLMLARQKTSLSGRRIALLNSIGFDWRILLQNGVPGNQITLHDGKAYIPRVASNNGQPFTCPSDAEFASALTSEAGFSIESEASSGESEDEDSQSTTSDGDMPPLVQPHPVESYSFENLTDMGTFNGTTTQCTTQFDFKPSPNARRVSADTNPGEDTKSCSVVDDSFMMPDFDLEQTQHSSMSPGFHFDVNQHIPVLTEFGNNASRTQARAPCNADAFVDSLLNDDFSGHDFSRDPIVMEDDEVVEV